MQYENALALRTSLETGFRIDDVLNILPKNINGRKISIVAQKTGKPDTKVVSIDLVKRLRQISRNGFVFCGRFGNKPRTRQAVWKDVKKAAKILKLSGNIAPHTARKTYGVEDFRENGLGQAQKDLQHNDVNTTMLYAFADLIDKFPAVKNAPCAADKTQTRHANGVKIGDIDIDDFAETVAARVVSKLLQAFAQGEK